MADLGSALSSAGGRGVGAIVRGIAMLTTEVMMTPRTLNNPSKTDDQDYGQCGSGGEIGPKKRIDSITGKDDA